MARALGGAVLSVCCALNFSPAVAAAAAKSSTPKPHPLEGLWEPQGGALMDPTARAMPANKGIAMPELRVFPPYNAEYQARYDKTTNDLRAGVKLIDGSARCEPQGMPRMMVIGYPIDIIVQPKRVVMLFEPSSQRRIIYTDGRKHTDPEVIDPTFSGESIGHWEGETLVVDTVGIREDLMFDYTFAPHSDALHIKERIRRVGETIEDDMVIEDPKAFTKPWIVKRVLKHRPEWELKEFVCEAPYEFRSKHVIGKSGIKVTAALLVAAAVAMASTPVALAHHSFAMYDNDHEVVLEGVVREFRWKNPHGAIFLTVMQNNQPVEYAIELSSLNNMSRLGWTRNSVKVGERLKVTMHPLKDGSKAGSFMSLVKADGTFMGPTAPP